jgi:hypothetical protein
MTSACSLALSLTLCTAAFGIHDPPRHPRTAPDADRFATSRSGAALDLPVEEDAFFFVIFGDRTTGPAEGVRVLAQAVDDANLLEPDLVMTVGDLIEGYNPTPAWLEQAAEFKGIMDRLCCPWFPVAGNHDVYYRGPDRPAGEHEATYERHFGPLWYAFEHKGAWFIVLYSDEGDPATGAKSFEQPAAQTMSPAQYAWLSETLARTAAAPHVFVFLHHPRWLGGGYGNDWERVHRLLAGAGNVRAVFAGHIHRMRHDGVRDGIEYVTLATTGGAHTAAGPRAGYLHHFHVVTVRPDHVAIAAVPVGEVLDVRRISGAVSDAAATLAQTRPVVVSPLAVARDGTAQGEVRLRLSNPVDRPIEVTIRAESDDSRWHFEPDHRHGAVAPGATAEFGFRARRGSGPVDDAFRVPRFVQQIDYLGDGLRVPTPEVALDVPLQADLAPPPRGAGEMGLVLDGRRDALRVASDQLALEDGPLTLECWFKAHRFGERTGLITKAENSEFGIFVNQGAPAFIVFLGDRYAEARADGPPLAPGRWHHVAGVFDGGEVRLYLDGKLAGAVKRSGVRRSNGLPLLVGADVDAGGAAVSHFDGTIDAVRLSHAARYSGPAFQPARRLPADPHTRLLLDMDGAVGPWAYDGSGRAAHPTIEGSPRFELVE